MLDSPFVVAVTAATFLLAGFVKGVIGIGLPTVAVGLLALVMTPAQAAAILVIPSMVTNLWQLAVGPSLGALLRRLWPMLAGICAGTWAGAGILVADTTGWTATALGAVLVAYAVAGLAVAPMRVPARAEPWLGPIVGVATGIVTSATGSFVIPSLPYLQALDLDRDELVQALGLSFTVSTAAIAVSLFHGGAFQPQIAWASALALAPAVAGMYLGQWVRGRVRPRTFRLCFFAGMLALGAHLVLRGLL